MKRHLMKKQSLIVVFLLLLVLNVSCSGQTESTVAPMEKTEKEALYSTIQGFLGNWWNGSDLYPDPCGWTPIQGVDCDAIDGLWYVTGLSIGPIHDNYPSCTENSEVRSHLFEFKHLKTLSFYNCFVSPNSYVKSISSLNWEKLAGTLESLEFRENPGLTGRIPQGLGEIMKLQSLVLLENGLSGALPTNLGNLVSLRRLVLSGNRFTGEIPASLGNLTKLLIFDPSRNYLTGVLPKTIGGLSSLLKLDLSNNYLSGKLPSEIGNLKTLTLLDLRNNKFSGGLTQSLQEVTSVEEMVLSNNPIGGNLMGFKWENLQNLVTLDLSKMGLTGEVPESIGELKRLRFLGLNNNNLIGNLSPKLADLPALSTVRLNGNNFSGELKFSKWFYEKMGRRFGAWSNPNLCYPVELLSITNVPVGIKPCREKLSYLNIDSGTKLDTDESVGQTSAGSKAIPLKSSVLCCTFDGSWWEIGVQKIVVVLLPMSFIL
ncbi:hypothetical protein MKX01_038195 [Papaver californicum]|nr:hypothetical protein MKX01_038195 [Papaver californicum]